MKMTTRRNFLTHTAAIGAATALPLGGCVTTERTGPHVIVVGGGFGGATAAKYLTWFDPDVRVTLVEAQKTYATCPFSNLVLGGMRSMESITQTFDALKARGVNVVHDTVVAVDPKKRTVKTKGGTVMNYDRMIVSPGIDFRYEKIEGYGPAAAGIMPHAWKAGPQTVLLRKQLEAMPDGGTVILAPPGNPFRCPPGPYERASMIAHYLKHHKPKSKILILDAKEKFSKKKLFVEGWKQHYKGMIEWVPASKDGKVLRVDPKTMTVHTEFSAHKGNVINVIPPQKAAKLAFAAGLTNKKGWCPIHFQTFESTQHPGIHVLGDASIATKMPKSGNSASTQAKTCAAAVLALLNGNPPATPTTSNTCYSVVAEDHGISVSFIYELTKKGYIPVPKSGGVSPMKMDAKFRAQEARYAEGWYKNITQDIWG